MSKHGLPLIQKLSDEKIINVPKWMIPNVHFLTIVGSFSYGVSADMSDVDVLGWCMPPLNHVFPHLAGHIEGFGQKPDTFQQWSQHHIKSPDGDDTEYDMTVYSVVKYINLVMENNPNMIDSIFVPNNCITHITRIGQIFRDNRKKFLHKGSYGKYRGYAFSQISKLENHSNSSNEKRKSYVETMGYDGKFAYHIARLLNQVIQILIEGDLDIQRSREELKAIRRGEFTLEQFKKLIDEKLKNAEEVYARSTIPIGPDVDFVRGLLVNVIEEQYGTVSKAMGTNSNLLNELQNLVERYS